MIEGKIKKFKKEYRMSVVQLAKLADVRKSDIMTLAKFSEIAGKVHTVMENYSSLNEPITKYESPARAKRTLASKTQKELAFLIGIGKSDIAKAEKGKDPETEQLILEWFKERDKQVVNLVGGKK